MNTETARGAGQASAGLASHNSYRSFFQALVEAKKRLNPRLSYRRLSEIMGFKSPNYIQLILEGKRNLSPEMALQIARVTKLTANERDYFISLVKREHAKTATETNQAERERLAALKRIVAKEIPSAQQEVLSQWYHLLVRELFLLPRHSSEPRWIASMLGGCISEEQAEESVKLLCRSGFLVPEGSSFRVADPVLHTNDEDFQAVFMRRHHAALLRVWADKLDVLGPLEQELGVLNIPINSKKIPELRRRVKLFLDEIVGFVQDEDDADRVVQLGTYLIPYPSEDSGSSER